MKSAQTTSESKIKVEVSRDGLETEPEALSENWMEPTL